MPNDVQLGTCSSGGWSNVKVQHESCLYMDFPVKILLTKLLGKFVALFRKGVGTGGVNHVGL